MREFQRQKGCVLHAATLTGIECPLPFANDVRAEMTQEAARDDVNVLC